MTGRALLTAIIFGSAIAGTRPMAHAMLVQPQQPKRHGADKSAPRACNQAVRAAAARCPS